MDGSAADEHVPQRYQDDRDQQQTLEQQLGHHRCSAVARAAPLGKVLTGTKFSTCCSQSMQRVARHMRASLLLSARRRMPRTAISTGGTPLLTTTTATPDRERATDQAAAAAAAAAAGSPGCC
eukprot:SAG31_NODE_6603_length_1955_cov_1.674569_1_plen_122_part_10